jgi:hypothetical protein
VRHLKKRVLIIFSQVYSRAIQTFEFSNISGDLKTGLDLCRKLKLKSLQKECAEILEQMKQLTEAAALYEAGGYYDKAAQLNIKLKNWQKIGQLLPHISSPKVVGNFLQMMHNNIP